MLHSIAAAIIAHDLLLLMLFMRPLSASADLTVLKCQTVAEPVAVGASLWSGCTCPRSAARPVSPATPLASSIRPLLLVWLLLLFPL